jgi:hypothetical protein
MFVGTRLDLLTAHALGGIMAHGGIVAKGVDKVAALAVALAQATEAELRRVEAGEDAPEDGAPPPAAPATPAASTAPSGPAKATPEARKRAG